MLNAGVLTFKEFAMREPLPLSTIHGAVLQFLLLAFPNLKSESGTVSEELKALGVNEEIMRAWYELVSEEINQPSEEEEFD